MISKGEKRGKIALTSSSILLVFVIVSFATTMYIRVGLDFKRNVFRLLGFAIASVLLLLTTLYYLSMIEDFLLLSFFLFSSIFLFINEAIRIYLRKHSMGDILENHPRLYWLTRGKIVKKSPRSS
jgi:hypothetical protein